MKDTIQIFGHKNPDTDSVCAAISLSYLKNQEGLNTEAKILSEINDETKYVLNRFNFKIPEILDDVKLEVKDTNYHKDFKINYKESVYRAFFEMQKDNLSTIPVIDNNKKFIGSFAMKDIAKNEILGDNSHLHTNYDLLLEAISGTEILRFDNEIVGNIINASIKSTTFLESDLLSQDSILIIGDRHSIIEEAVNKKIKLLIITYSSKMKSEHLELAKKNKVNVIYTKKSTFETMSKIIFANYIDEYEYDKNLVCVKDTTHITDFNDVIQKTKHSYYPVVNEKNECLGLIKLSDLQDYKPKQVFLVDHNELSQSVEGLEEAHIVGIIDHHRLGNIGTLEPINFRNMIVGSTCTIVYELYKEANLKIPTDIASLLLAGIISDTLCLKSPTTTEIDIKIVKELSKLTKINYEKLAIDMLKANDQIKSKSIKEIIYMDFKTFTIDKKVVAIGQVNTLNSKAILKQKASYIRFLNREAKNKNFDIMIFSITDIFKNGSYIIFNEEAKEKLRMAYNNYNLEQGDFLENVISRKKQLLPPIIGLLK